MHSPVPPKVKAVQVVAAQPTENDSAAITHLSATERRSIDPVTYLVKVQLEEKMPYTSSGWALYVGNTRIPKYWEYEQGIYFKVIDPQFFVEHQGENLRFTQDEVEFVDAGAQLGAPEAVPAAATRRLRTQEEALK